MKIKKKILTLFMTTVFITTSFSAVFAADTSTTVSVTTAKMLGEKSVYISGKVSNPSENQELTIIAVKLENGVEDNQNSVYIDQQNSIINDDGTFSLTFSPKVSLDKNSEYIVKVGGTNITQTSSMKIKTDATGTVSKVYVGDSDGDGEILVNDASLALQYVLNNENIDDKYKNDPNFTDRMDVFGDKIINARNVSAILEKALNKSFEFVRKDPIEGETATESTSVSESEKESVTESAAEVTTSKPSVDDNTETTTAEIIENVQFDGDMLVYSDLPESIPEENKFKTLREAVESISTVPSEESQRVTIDIMPGVYRGQYILNTPYVTLRKNPNYDGEVKFTSYYGLGSLYDSIATEADEQKFNTEKDDKGKVIKVVNKGYYSPLVAGDGICGKPNDWGPALKVDNKATDVIIKDITFENSYNSYYTDEELEDGLEVDPDTGTSMFERKKFIQEQIVAGKDRDYINKWLQSKCNLQSYKNDKGETKFTSARERAAAFICSADKFTAYNCSFLGKQDVLSPSGDGKRQCYINCLVSGTVDFICGSADAVFYGCELKFNAGPDMSDDELCIDHKKQEDGGHITSPANKEYNKGDLFYNCRITGTETAVPGNFGRPWELQKEPQAIFYNTVIENNKSGESLIQPGGWSDMTDCPKDEARFFEYNSVDSNNKPIDLTKRVKNKYFPGTVLDKWQILEFNPYDFIKGNDGWNPMEIKDEYKELENIIEEITFPETATGGAIELPVAPQGFEYHWESKTSSAQVSQDQKTISVVQPAKDQDPVKGTVAVYILNSETNIGIKRNVEFTIPPSESTENTFSLNGTVTSSKIVSQDVNVNIQLVKENVVIATQNVIIVNGSNKQEFTIKYLPAGEYSVNISSSTSGYNIINPEGGKAVISGTSDTQKTLNVSVGKLAEISIKTTDFTESWAAPIAAEQGQVNVSAAVVSKSDDGVTANIGENNKAVRFTKDADKIVGSDVGFYFDIAKAVKENNGTLENTDTLQFSYDLLLEKCKKEENGSVIDTGYMASDYSYIDFTTKLSKDSVNSSRYVRHGIHNGWNQLNFFGCTNYKINGNNTQFDENDTMENKWYHIVTDIDLKKNTVKVTVYNRDKGNILNEKPFVISEPSSDGTNPKYPADIIDNALFAAIYMDSKANTENKIEFYIDNMELKYKDFE